MHFPTDIQVNHDPRTQWRTSVRWAKSLSFAVDHTDSLVRAYKNLERLKEESVSCMMVQLSREEYANVESTITNAKYQKLRHRNVQDFSDPRLRGHMFALYSHSIFLDEYCEKVLTSNFPASLKELARRGDKMVHNLPTGTHERFFELMDSLMWGFCDHVVARDGLPLDMFALWEEQAGDILTKSQRLEKYLDNPNMLAVEDFCKAPNEMPEASADQDLLIAAFMDMALPVYLSDQTNGIEQLRQVRDIVNNLGEIEVSILAYCWDGQEVLQPVQQLMELVRQYILQWCRYEVEERFEMPSAGPSEGEQERIDSFVAVCGKLAKRGRKMVQGGELMEDWVDDTMIVLEAFKLVD